MTQRCIALTLLVLGSSLLWAQTSLPPAVQAITFTNIASFVQQARTGAVALAQVQGAVSSVYPGASFYIQGSSGGLMIAAQTNTALGLGELVEVEGTLKNEGFSPVLVQTSMRKVGIMLPVEPIDASAPEILSGQNHMQLVRLSAKVVEAVNRRHPTVVLRLIDQNISFSAEYYGPQVPREWRRVVPQAEVSLTGVCTIGGNKTGFVPQFRILLRQPEDLVVTRPPPWWTFERTLRAVIVLGLLILGGLIWVAALNNQVRQQTRELRARFEREAALEDQYHELFENAQELVFTLQPDGRFVSMDKASEQTLGCQRYEGVGKSFIDYVVPEERERFRSYLKESLLQRTSRLEEFVVETQRGTRVPLELSCHLTAHVMSRARSEPELQVIARDITERKRAEARIRELTQDLEKRVVERTSQLEAANLEPGAFTYSVSHDLRAPLRAIDGFSRILLQENLAEADEDTRHLLEGIHKNSRKMSQLIDDLLQFSRVTRTSLVTSEIDLEELFRIAFEEQMALQGERTVEFELAKLPKVRGDLPMLRQVVENLLSNALKYTRPRETAKIRVGIQPGPDGNHFFVQDNGVGFDMRYAGKLFGVFQRLHTEREFEGTGVGLAIVHRVIQRHGGRVWADAVPGKGTTVYFSLPNLSPPQV